MSTFVVNGTSAGSAGDAGAGVTTRPSAPTDRLTSDSLIFHVVFRQPRTSSTRLGGHGHCEGSGEDERDTDQAAHRHLL